MGKLHIFVDGSWLFKVCSAGGALSYTTASPTYPFAIGWDKLGAALVDHVKSQRTSVVEIGDRYISTSIFVLPPDFDDWPNRMDNVTSENVERTKKVVYARTRFKDAAIEAGYSSGAVFTPEIKPWILHKLQDGTYQEKQVDTTIVALLVRYAITRPDDYHAVVTGDADMIPAMKVAYPEYTKNVMIVSTHPDELDSSRRQTSFSYLDFRFGIEPFYLQQSAERIMAGNHIYRCVECGKLFSLPRPVPKSKQPRCQNHRG